MEPFRELTPEEIEFIDRVNAIYLRKNKKIPFAEILRQYREIEAEFVERERNLEVGPELPEHMRDAEYRIVETKRRITEWLLIEALDTRQPHQICRAIWEELQERGFSDINQEENFSGIYARCCQRNGEFDVGIEVLDKRIAVLEKMLADPDLIPTGRDFCEEHLRINNKIRDELRAGLRK